MSPPRRIFQLREIEAAYQFAAEGGQALHLMPESFAHLRADTPNCFKGRGEIAHLFDQNLERLTRTARSLGVRIIKVERQGARGQHIDLCGGPLARARTQFAANASSPAAPQAQQKELF